MQTSNSDQNISVNNTVFYLLGEYPLGEFMSVDGEADELTAGFLDQPFRELGIQPETIENIEMTLAGFAKEALVHNKQTGSELPWRIRVFCQKKMVKDSNSVTTSRLFNAEQAMEQAQIIHPSGTKIIGGWGYFLIERGGRFAAGSSTPPRHWIDIYLYKEGE